MKIISFLVFILCLAGCSYIQGLLPAGTALPGVTATPTPAPIVTPVPVDPTEANQLSPTDESLINFVLEQIDAYASKAAVTYPMCNGQRFKPCVCWKSVPKTVQYRPSISNCKGNAAVLLSGDMINAFSVVVRDTENSDQSTPGCAAASCSVFKVQSKAIIGSGATKRRVNCLGAKGTDPRFKKVVRITVKVSDKVRPDGTKDMRRFCLNKPTLGLN